jgi:hypothetical protein
MDEGKDGKGSTSSFTKMGTRGLESPTSLVSGASRGGELIYQYAYIYSYKLNPFGLFFS